MTQNESEKTPEPSDGPPAPERPRHWIAELVSVAFAGVPEGVRIGLVVAGAILLGWWLLLEKLL